jgi:hypothetical protein
MSPVVRAAMRARGWAVEHDQGGGNAVVDGDGFVGHEAAGDGPSFLGVDDGARRLERTGRDAGLAGQVGTGGGPHEERPGSQRVAPAPPN